MVVNKKYYFLSKLVWIHRCETRGYQGPTVFIEKKLCISGPGKFKPVLFKGQLYVSNMIIILLNDMIPTPEEFTTTGRYRPEMWPQYFYLP